ncbi:MAG: hypothetical protein DBY17_05045 [Oscillospiraceae bacterium]|nr:MAG: hypothetical protein DBY17_05045 [Oscillospiraceae bacterium]
MKAARPAGAGNPLPCAAQKHKAGGQAASRLFCICSAGAVPHTRQAGVPASCAGRAVQKALCARAAGRGIFPLALFRKTDII